MFNLEKVALLVECESRQKQLRNQQYSIHSERYIRKHKPECRDTSVHPITPPVFVKKTPHSLNSHNSLCTAYAEQNFLQLQPPHPAGIISVHLT